MSDRDRPNLLAIQEAIEHIQRYTAELNDADEFYENDLVFEATLMNFVVIGEMADRLSEDLRRTYADVPWAKIKGFRNMIAHEYLGIDAEEVWQIIHDHVPDLKKQVERILAAPDNS